MGKSVEDIKIGLQVLLNPNIHKIDPFQFPSEFKEDLYQKALNKKVRVGYFKSFRLFPVT